MAIYFVRHGQSEFNAAFQGEIDPLIFDAPLTQLGFEQAARARDTIEELGISRVITSPLTRAVQTALTLFDGIVPIEVQHGHHERLTYSGDVGRPPEQLRVDFPKLAFDHLPARWWHAHDDLDVAVPYEPLDIFENRIAGFVTQLADIKDENIAFVGHGNAFELIIGYMLNNCQIHRYR